MTNEYFYAFYPTRFRFNALSLMKSFVKTHESRYKTKITVPKNPENNIIEFRFEFSERHVSEVYENYNQKSKKDKKMLKKVDKFKWIYSQEYKGWLDGRGLIQIDIDIPNSLGERDIALSRGELSFQLYHFSLNLMKCLKNTDLGNQLLNFGKFFTYLGPKDKNILIRSFENRVRDSYQTLNLTIRGEAIVQYKKIVGKRKFLPNIRKWGFPLLVLKYVSLFGLFRTFRKKTNDARMIIESLRVLSNRFIKDYPEFHIVITVIDSLERLVNKTDNTLGFLQGLLSTQITITGTAIGLFSILITLLLTLYTNLYQTFFLLFLFLSITLIGMIRFTTGFMISNELRILSME